MLDRFLRPSREPELPSHIYRGFDIALTPEGGKRYTIPHSLKGTLLAILAAPVSLGSLGIAAMLSLWLSPRMLPAEPLGLVVWWLLALAPILAGLTVIVAVLLWLTGYRSTFSLTIREDGLIIGDRHFLEREHLQAFGYGISIREGKFDETFEPKLEVQYGTRTIVLAEDLDVAAGKLFKTLFEDDIRHYWHRHN